MYFGSAMTQMDIILPAYNPLPGWEDVVIKRFLSLEKQLPDIQLQLIIVNDGSSTIDESVSVGSLKKNIKHFHWISYPQNKGKGYALRKGVNVSNSRYIIYTDIDWPYTERSMTGMANLLMGDADVVVGVREMHYYENLPSIRRLISKMLRTINAGILRLKVNDTQAGLKGFRENIKTIFLQTTINRYLFDLEFIYLISKRQLNVVPFPVELSEGVKFSRMNYRVLWHEARNFLKIWMRGGH